MSATHSVIDLLRYPGIPRRLMRRSAGKLLVAGLTLCVVLGGWSAATPCQSAETVDSTAVRGPSPKGALLRSAFYPGWGQLANGKPFKACVIMAVEAYFAGVAINAERSARDAAELARGAATSAEAAAYENRAAGFEDRRTAYLWWLGATVLYSMLDAYVDANLAGVPESAAKPPPVLLDSDLGPGATLRLGLVVTF